ncbi:MAG: hypothetical protein D6795_18710 [Deltaproteobacteria bacterium]|nr:MAG: hypothetical protein D6795_18710 [Deltaproteobacteria bacterium]
MPAAFTMLLSRSRKTARELLGESFSGVVGSDRWGAYNWISTLHCQLCWAHLIRDFRRIAERDDEDSRRVGERLLDAGQKGLRLHDRDLYACQERGVASILAAGNVLLHLTTDSPLTERP